MQVTYYYSYSFHQLAIMNEMITGCPVGMYLSAVYQECRNCPRNSMSVESGLSECPCFDGFGRAEGEEDLPCTR